MSKSRKRWLCVPLLVSTIGLLCSCGDEEGRVDAHKASALELLGGFPRPDMARQGFQSLEGEWDFEYDGEDVGINAGWFSNPDFSRKIVVPFCVESEASGIEDLDPPPVVWYAKRFVDELPETPGRTLLHFGAVDNQATVWLNGRYLGEHNGGYTPFSFEVDGILDGDNLLVVRVEDTNDLSLPRGKQSMTGEPFLIFYETVTGIWQSVWMERTGEVYLEGYRAYTDLDKGEVRLACRLAGGQAETEVTAVATSPTGERVTGNTRLYKNEGTAEAEITLDCGELAPWSPEKPNLYGLKFTIDAGTSRDEVDSYFGARAIEVRAGKVWLNGEPLYQKLVLHQGYYPEGLYTPLSPAVFKEDVRQVKAFGFNGLRMHVKNEAPPFYFWCDYLGCLVDQDMPSAFSFTSEMREALEREWREIVDRNFNHPSIVTWIPFNECWGVGVGFLPVLLLPEAKEYVKYIYHRTKAWDPTRPVIDNSGYDHTSVTDIVDVHQYLDSLDKCQKLYDELRDLYAYRWSLLRMFLGADAGVSTENVFARGEAYSGQPVIISEYGGFGFYDTGRGQTLLESYKAYTEQILRQEHIQGYCYTQFNDTWQEENGLVDMNRQPKVPPEEIRAINDWR
jgi:beta-galactosidase/beta-glucuronidase